jgi:hypothetical protein
VSSRELRPELLKQCDILQALLAFNYKLTQKTKDEIQHARELIPRASAKELRSLRDQLRENIKNCVKAFRLIDKLDRFAATFIVASRKSHAIPNVSKAVIDRTYFGNFCSGHPQWKKYPPHLRLQVHYDWVVDPNNLVFHYWLPEAVLYEDMALAYNMAVDTVRDRNEARGPGGNVKVKRHHLHVRTAILSAYYFVEAYLNGIAFDFHYHHADELEEKHSDLLMEWDSTRKKTRFVSFEKKITEYPKIILGLQHPKITETTSPNLKVLSSDAKELRDAIVHQSPKGQDLTDMPSKVKSLSEADLAKTTEVVDAAVRLVKELNASLGPHGMFLDWLHEREGTTGQFPASSFE